MRDPRVVSIASRLVGLPIWFVNAGGAASTTFSLALGRKVPRGKALENPGVSDDFRRCTGEANLYVWCSWRLESGDSISSSDQDSEHFLPILRRLEGERVTSVEVVGPAHDLSLLAGRDTLRLFCDHVPPDPSAELNWELVFSGSSVLVGPGFEVEMDERG